MARLEMAAHVEGRAFGRGELATSNTIDHGMTDIDFMVFCDENPLPILCECGCKEVADHNARVRRTVGL